MIYSTLGILLFSNTADLHFGCSFSKALKKDVSPENLIVNYDGVKS